VIAAIGINRAASLIGATLANRLQQRREIIEDILDTGFSANNERVAETCFHTVTQLRTELSQVATTVTIHGLTGPGGWLTVVIDAHFGNADLPAPLAHPDPLETALLCARLADRHPELVPSSSLLFAVGKRA
jgi:hypothetical protein